jgi:hypothetical protein
MATEEISRMAEAKEGGMKPIMTASDKSRPVSSPPQQPSDTGNLWAQIRQNLELAGKLLPLVWSVFLFIGGLNFLFYYGTIGFMPELDLKASITLLATSASIGTFLFITLGAVLIGPALSWLGLARNSALKFLWYDEGAEFPRRSTIFWFILPLAGFSVPSLLIIIGWQWWGKLSARVGFPVSLGLILIVTGCCLWRRLPNHLNSHDKWTAMFYLLSSPFLSMMMFWPLLLFADAIISSDQSYETNQTVWIILTICFVLIYNTVLVKATYLPTLKLLFMGIAILLLLNLYFPFARPVPKASMNWFQFGNIQHASLILDEVGCNISRSHSLSVEKRVPDPKTCVLPDVMILSRLGTPYYIQMAGPPQKRLTIPAENVLSWSVIESKSTTPTELPQSP